MNDPKKFVKNTLFSPSVTGSTYEDFTQHAILLPAMEKPPPKPVVNIVPVNNLSTNIKLFRFKLILLFS